VEVNCIALRSVKLLRSLARGGPGVLEAQREDVALRLRLLDEADQLAAFAGVRVVNEVVLAELAAVLPVAVAGNQGLDAAAQAERALRVHAGSPMARGSRTP